MNRRRQAPTTPTFPSGYRASGVLLHVTSLPSRYGIGDIGPAARDWIDRLHDARQAWWQVLPLGPNGAGNSPYQPQSSFAGNWLLISPDDLITDGLLQDDDVADATFPESSVDYTSVSAFKNRLLEIVWKNFAARASPELRLLFGQFCDDHRMWLDDYALFHALQLRYQGAYYLDWPTDLVRRNPAALADARQELAAPIEKVQLAQFLVMRQGMRLKDYAHSQGVRLIGDLPFFCLTRFERCVGESGIVSSGQAAATAIRCGRASRLLQFKRSAVGQPCL